MKIFMTFLEADDFWVVYSYARIDRVSSDNWFWNFIINNDELHFQGWRDSKEHIRAKRLAKRLKIDRVG